MEGVKLVRMRPAKKKSEYAIFGRAKLHCTLLSYRNHYKNHLLRAKLTMSQPTGNIKLFQSYTACEITNNWNHYKNPKSQNYSLE